jgi:predicted nucleic acid-binding protein
VSELKEILTDILSIIVLLPCSNKSYLQCLKTTGNDIEDALLYQLALENNLDYFITEDKRGFKKLVNRELPVVTAKEFLSINC